jgi:hypothetical protein
LFHLFHQPAKNLYVLLQQQNVQIINDVFMQKQEDTKYIHTSTTTTALVRTFKSCYNVAIPIERISPYLDLSCHESSMHLGGGQWLTLLLDKTFAAVNRRLSDRSSSKTGAYDVLPTVDNQ